VINPSHKQPSLGEAVRVPGARSASEPPKGPPMNYASAFAYASKSILSDPYAPARPHRKVRHRRRRIQTGPLHRDSR
jgi:hypothetical protein